MQAGNKSQVCKMERLHCFVFAQDYHCSCHLHSPPIIIIVIIIIVIVIVVIIVIIVVIITVVISLDSSLVALVAPGVVCHCMVQSGLWVQMYSAVFVKIAKCICLKCRMYFFVACGAV